MCTASLGISTSKRNILLFPFCDRHDMCTNTFLFEVENLRFSSNLLYFACFFRFLRSTYQVRLLRFAVHNFSYMLQLSLIALFQHSFSHHARKRKRNTPSHSRHALLGTLAPMARCFGLFASPKRYSTVFACKLPTALHLEMLVFVFLFWSFFGDTYPRALPG